MADHATSGAFEAMRVFARRHARGIVYAVGLAPAVWTFALAFADALGPDPAKTLERTLGLWALRFLVAGLAITPLMKLGGINLVRYRRAIGLIAFYYAALHLTAYAAFDLGLDWPSIWRDIVKRPYIAIGFAGFVILIPLAVTSSDRMIRRLGAVAWRRLHRLTYLAAIAATTHHLLLVKVVTLEPLAYAGSIMLLLALRLLPPSGRRSRIRQHASTIERAPQRAS